MSYPSLRVLKYLLALSLLVGALPAAMAGSAPTLFSVTSGKAEVLAQGAQKSWPIKLSEDSALDAVFQGGMWLPNPSGGRIYAKYQRHIIHPNGTWTWIGTVSTAHGDQSVVLTFGKEGAFGLIPQASGYPLRIVTRAGQTRVVETSAEEMARSTEALQLRSKPDFVIPPRTKPVSGHDALSPAPTANHAVKAAASGPVIIDVMVAYTPGVVSYYGSPSQALTRIQNLVDLTNQAYTASGVNQQIRLVHTVEVNYPDNTSNSSALDDITGVDSNGNPIPVPASLQDIAPLRFKYGADLVTLIRSFDNTTQGNCGEGWLIGGNETPIVPSQQKAYGYSVVSDGSNSDGTLFCLDSTFPHELGHNMGDAHDRANAGGVPGAYSYSYGYLGNGSSGFSTIMAYGTAETTPLYVFSNPNISTCQNKPCGVADSSSSSADNAHSMNNTASLIAQFEPTADINTGGNRATHNDINGDGKSDVLFTNSTTHQLLYWLMNGSKFAGWAAFTTSSKYKAIATGDFNGDGHTDILWDAAGTLHMWLNDGRGGFVDKVFLATPSSGWRVVGTGDIDDRGNDDIFWYNPSTHQLTYWYVDGATYIKYGSATVPSGFSAVGVGDLNGDGIADVVWTSSSNKLNVWIGDGIGFTQYQSTAYIGPGWIASGVGDINGDGYDDVVWYQPSTGGLQYWLMAGSQVTGYKTNYAGSAYSFAGVGDFDGDGYADILWTAGGDNLWMWLHKGPYSFYGAHVQTTFSKAWYVLP